MSEQETVEQLRERVELEKQLRALRLEQEEEADLRDFCQEAGAKYIWLKAFIRKMIAGTKGLEKSDCIYAIMLAKQNGLPVTGTWYVPIPRQNGEGFTLCFTLDAALYILNHDPRVDQSTIDWWFTDRDGKKHPKETPPSYGSVNDIDQALTCTVSAALKATGKEMQYTCRYRDWVATRRNDQRGGVIEPKPLWIKMAAHMIFKQTVKEWVRVYLGSALEFEDRTSEAEEKALPAAEKSQSLFTADQSAKLGLISHATGIELPKLVAGAHDFLHSGGTFEAFIQRWEPSAKPVLPPVQRVQELQETPKSSEPGSQNILTFHAPVEEPIGMNPEPETSDLGLPSADEAEEQGDLGWGQEETDEPQPPSPAAPKGFEPL